MKILNSWMKKKENNLTSRLLIIFLPILLAVLFAAILSHTLFTYWVLENTVLYFFDNNFVLLFCVIYILLVSVWYLYKSIFLDNNCNTKKLFKNLCIMLFLLLLFWNIILFAVLNHKIELTMPSYYKISTFLCIIIVNIILSLGLISLIDFSKNKFKKFIVFIQTIYFYLFPLLSFIIVEIIIDSEVNSSLIYIIGNLLVYYFLFFIIYAILKYKKVVLFIFGTFCFIFGAADYFVYSFRGHPILATDIWSLNTALSVSNNYTYNLSFEFLIGLTLYLSQILVICLLFSMRKDQLHFTHYIINFVKCSLLVAICSLLLHSDVFSVEVNKWTPIYTYKLEGTALCLYNELIDAKVQKPEGYSVDKVKNITKKIELTQKNNSSSDSQPNIIVIMDEAFSDLGVVKDLSTSEDYMPFIHSLTENTVKGKLLVSIYGGNTCNTEFEFLTGNSLAFLPQGCVPYQQYVKTKLDSMSSVMKSQNYVTTGIHPYNKYGWSRNRVYPLLGIDTFLSMDDFTNPNLLRGYISDEDSFNKIIDISNQNNTVPNFIFNVTMQNHGGYTRTVMLDNWIHVTQSTSYLPDLEQYLTSIRATDEAFKNLITYYKRCKEPTIILLFGDHQPGLTAKAQEYLYSDIKDASLGEQQKKYMVPFVLWANYDIEEKDDELISANYLSSYLLNFANVKSTPFNKYLLELRKRIPAINAFGYLGDDGNWYDFDQKTEYSDAIKEYQYIQYNNMFDQHNKIKEFFELKD